MANLIFLNSREVEMYWFFKKCALFKSCLECNYTLLKFAIAFNSQQKLKFDDQLDFFKNRNLDENY